MFLKQLSENAASQICLPVLSAGQPHFKLSDNLFLGRLIALLPFDSWFLNMLTIFYFPLFGPLVYFLPPHLIVISSFLVLSLSVLLIIFRKIFILPVQQSLCFCFLVPLTLLLFYFSLILYPFLFLTLLIISPMFRLEISELRESVYPIPVSQAIGQFSLQFLFLFINILYYSQGIFRVYNKSIFDSYPVKRLL